MAAIGLTFDQLCFDRGVAEVVLNCSLDQLYILAGSRNSGKPVASAEADLPAMRLAAKAAGILDVIESLPEGFDSWIGRKG